MGVKGQLLGYGWEGNNFYYIIDKPECLCKQGTIQTLTIEKKKYKMKIIGISTHVIGKDYEVYKVLLEVV